MVRSIRTMEDRFNEEIIIMVRRFVGASPLQPALTGFTLSGPVRTTHSTTPLSDRFFIAIILPESTTATDKETSTHVVLNTDKIADYNGYSHI